MSADEVEKEEEKVEVRAEEEAGVGLAVVMMVTAATVTGLAGAGLVAGVLAVVTVAMGLVEAVKAEGTAVAAKVVAGWVRMKVGVVKAVVGMVGVVTDVVGLATELGVVGSVLDMLVTAKEVSLEEENVGEEGSVEVDLADEQTEKVLMGKEADEKGTGSVEGRSGETAAEAETAWEVRAAVERVLAKVDSVKSQAEAGSQGVDLGEEGSEKDSKAGEAWDGQQ